MIVLNENFDRAQRDRLRRWRIRTRQVGDGFGRKGLLDREIVGLLQRGRHATFISLDRGYYRRDWRHPRYCLAFLDVAKGREALYARRLLRHPRFDTEAKRLGHVIRGFAERPDVLAAACGAGGAGRLAVTATAPSVARATEGDRPPALTGLPPLPARSPIIRAIVSERS